MTPWKTAWASVPGDGHLDASLGNQDAARVASVSDAVVLAVADGLSSAPRSTLGAALTVDALIDEVQGAAQTGWPRDGAEWRELLDRVFTAARARVRAALGA